MPLSWNEIRHRAIGFSKEWSGARSESAEKQTFWNEFFDVFGIRRRAVASFEEPVKNLSGEYRYIDLFWPRIALVEHKSRGQDLGKAQSQAFRYIQDLINQGRLDEIPRYVIVSDFARIALHDLEPEDQRELPLFNNRRVATIEIPLADFHKHIHDFAFIPGYKQHKFAEQDPINLEAVEIMGRLHDALESGGYSGHQLERFLVRILFCLFAEDTGIFERESFSLYLQNRTATDGSDLGLHLARLFEVLNTPEERRQKNLDETLAAFRYVNGELFKEKLDFADFNREMREALLASSRFDWSRISPAIFGSLFQAVMEPRQRRQIGGHYTSERDILKVIRSLFLDDLRAEFDRIKNNKAALARFHEKIAALRFLDPACGCGNFLVITYRELRSLEIEILKLLYPGDQRELDIQRLSLVDVDAFYGIEISEWPARIAEVALWLMDHQMNLRLSEAFGQYFVRLPLKKSPTIAHGNALRFDWKQILPPKKCSYVLGNPPFVGKKARNADQQDDMKTVFGKIAGSGVLDYVCCWYLQAAQYIQGTPIKVSFVSTNSITQGEQPGIVWPILFGKLRIKIVFAHRTFPWKSEARGRAHVHVVIVGFAAFNTQPKRIYEYQSEDNGAIVSTASNISPYLIEASDIALTNREHPLSAVPQAQFGSMPNDDGNLLLTDDERTKLVEQEPEAGPLIRPLLSAREYLHGEKRWCLWLKDAKPQTIKKLRLVQQRVEAVQAYRDASKRKATKKLAKYPTLFGEIRQPSTNYVLVPCHSSENRRYIPLSYFTANYIPNNSCLFLEHATPYHFGVLHSEMNMAWVRTVCGRLESRYRYSAKLVYNNFPWPDNPTPKQLAAVEKAAQAVLDARAKFKDSTLADLYDPLATPPDLVKAHSDLDRAVDLCYRPQPFDNDRQRVEYLFQLYERLTSPLLPAEKKTKRPRNLTPNRATRP
ncbi:MAG TPA: DNA methyltransferase [Candidatus Solibacter sp.]|nr:DNA methyltransferase [Candidatus Solibacter sp.]